MRLARPARRGATVTGMDNSEEQLKTARALQAEHGLEFPLIHGNAESVPLPDVSLVRVQPSLRLKRSDSPRDARHSVCSREIASSAWPTKDA